MRSNDDDDGGTGHGEPEDTAIHDPSGVTITGAHQAVPRQDRFDPADPPTLYDADLTGAELPPWTDAPTGQVPAVLAREDQSDDPDDPWSALPSPTWRERDVDWTEEEQRFEPAMLGDEGGHAPIRSSDERRPWEFDAADDRGVEDDLDVEGPTLVGGTSATAAPATRVRARTARPRREPVAPSRGARPPHGPRDLRLAVLTGLALGVLVLVVFTLSTVASLVVAAAAVTLAAAEALRGMRLAGHRPATALGLVACLALMVAAYNKGVTALPLVSALALFFAFLWYLAGVERADVVDGVATTMLVYAWVGVLGSFAALMLAPSTFPDNRGIHYVLGTIIIVVANDLSALVIGKLVGSRPLAPTISPNKTWEGAIGAAVVTVVAGVMVGALMPSWTEGAGLALGIVACVLTPLGDLWESMLKRSLGVKDLGSSLPGHGGLLDRVDGLLFVLPAAYYVLLAYHLG